MMPLNAQAKECAGSLIRCLWARFLFYSGFLWWAKRSIRRWQGIAVLMFHHVLTDADYGSTHSEAAVIIRQRTFEELVRYARTHYEVVRIDQMPAWSKQRLKVRVAFTFDDGWADNAVVASPICSRYQMPMTIFVCPGLMGRISPFWPERVTSLLRALRSMQGVREIRAISSGRDDVKRGTQLRLQSNLEATSESVIACLKTCTPDERETWIAELSSVTGTVERSQPADSTLDWNDVQRLYKLGVAFGSHTVSHQILTQVSKHIARSELADSKRELEEKLGNRCLLFAYPNGNWSAEVRDVVAEAGYKAAFTTRIGIWTRNSDPLAIPRINICEDKVVNLFGRFSPIDMEYALFWKAYRGMKRPAMSQRERRIQPGVKAYDSD